MDRELKKQANGAGMQRQITSQQPPASPTTSTPQQEQVVRAVVCIVLVWRIVLIVLMLISQICGTILDVVVRFSFLVLGVELVGKQEGEGEMVVMDCEKVLCD
jgi:hypothetical protein